MCSELFICFFFKQKTAYELRISDWSSDVCSSDLLYTPLLLMRTIRRTDLAPCAAHYFPLTPRTVASAIPASISAEPATRSSEERRVGQECISTCRSR